MTDAPSTLSGIACNGDRPPENDQQYSSQSTEETADVGGTLPPCSSEPSLEDLRTKDQEESGKSKRHMLPTWAMDEKLLSGSEENLFVVHKAIADLSLQETSAEDTVFREGHQLKIPLSNSHQEINRPKEKIGYQPLEQTEDENTAYQATEIEWLGFRKPTQGNMLHSKHDEEEELWNEEIDEDDITDDCNNDEDEVRVIEFKKNHESSQLREEGNTSEDSPLSSPSSQPATPDEQPMLGKKGDISRSAYSRYNTISYRKIRKGNTKQRIDEFESMMHL